MKQAEITYNVKNGFATVTGYKNILTYHELIALLGLTKAWEYVKDGMCFYLVPAHAAPNELEFIRVGTSDNNTTFGLDNMIPEKRFNEIIGNMKIAGARLSEFVHGKTVTVKI